MQSLIENPRLGLASTNPALHPGHNLPNFTAAIRDSWSVASETRWSHEIGRFMSPDPSGLAYAHLFNPQSFNLYGYVQNNPLTNTDPTGLALQLSCSNDPDTAATSTDAKGNTTITTTAGAQHCAVWDDGQGQYRGTLPQLRLASFTPPSLAPGKGCGLATRVSQVALGAANLADAGVRATQLPTAVLGASSAPPVAGVVAVYGVTNIFGQVVSGVAQITGAITGNGGGRLQQIGNILSGPAAGLTTLAATGSAARAETAASVESTYTLGTGLIDKSLPILQRAAETALGAVGLTASGCSPGGSAQNVIKKRHARGFKKLEAPNGVG